MKTVLADIRYALRQARRSPGFAAVAVLILAVGIGAATAIYSVVDHILLRPLALPEADRLVTLCETHPPETRFCSVSTVNLSDWARLGTSFTAMGAARGWTMSRRTGDGARSVASGIATAGFFDVLAVAPERGRLFRSDDLPARPGGAAVIAHEFWQTELGGREDVIGSTLVLDDVPRTVVGVLPSGFRAPRLEWIRVWLPLHFAPDDEAQRGWRGFLAIARLRPGVPLEQAASELERIQIGLAESHPETVRGWGVRAEPTREHIVGPMRPVLNVFLAAVAVLLVIVCVNVANLLLARATARERELAVRLALGAGQARVTRQLLVETGALAAAGGIGGVVVAYAGTALFVALAPPGIPRIEEVAVDARILAFAVGMAGLSALAIGLVPAWRARVIDLAGAFREGRSGGGTARTVRLRRGLVVVQLGLALALVFAAALLSRSFATLTRWEPGFEVERLLTFSVFLSPGTYRTTGDVRGYLDRAETMLLSLPGIDAVGTVSAGPLFGGGDGRLPFLIEGRPPVPMSDAPTVVWFDAGPGYFETLGLPVLRGRTMSRSDGPASTPVAVVNEAMAALHWPGGSPVGERLVIPDLAGGIEIIGVVANVPPFTPGEQPQPEIYFSNRQQTRWATYFVLRTRSDPAEVARDVEATLASLDPDVTPAALRTMDEHVAAQLVRPRFNLVLVGVLALVALLLGAAGIFGVVAYAVALQRHEIGVRMALGADRRAVVRRVLADGARLLAAGLVLGAVVAFAFAGALRGLVVGIGTADPVAIVGTVAVLVAAVLLAALPPALRAAATDPADALRAE